MASRLPLTEVGVGLSIFTGGSCIRNERAAYALKASVIFLKCFHAVSKMATFVLESGVCGVFQESRSDFRQSMRDICPLLAQVAQAK